MLKCAVRGCRYKGQTYRAIPDPGVSQPLFWPEFVLACASKHVAQATIETYRTAAYGNRKEVAGCQK